MLTKSEDPSLLCPEALQAGTAAFFSGCFESPADALAAFWRPWMGDRLGASFCEGWIRARCESSKKSPSDVSCP